MRGWSPTTTIALLLGALVPHHLLVLLPYVPVGGSILPSRRLGFLSSPVPALSSQLPPSTTQQPVPLRPPRQESRLISEVPTSSTADVQPPPLSEVPEVFQGPYVVPLPQHAPESFKRSHEAQARWISSPQLSYEVRAICQRFAQQLQRDLPSMEKVAIYMSGGPSFIWSLWEEVTGSGQEPSEPSPFLVHQGVTNEWLQEKGWIARLLMYKSFPVGLVFIQLSPKDGEEVEEVVDPEGSIRLRVKQFSHELMDALMTTRQMRGRFVAWRQSYGYRRRSGAADTTANGEGKNGKTVIQLREEDLEEVHVDGSSLNTNLDRVILRLSLPLMVSLAMEPVFSLIDTFYIGKKLGSTNCLSAFGLSDRILASAFYMVNYVISTPITPVVSKLRVQGQSRQAFKLIFRLMGGAAVMGLGLVPLLRHVCRPLLLLMGACSENFEHALHYYEIRSFGAPAIMLNAIGIGALRGFLDTTTPLIITLLAFVIDYSLAPEAIFPQINFFPDQFALGLFGSTTVAAEYLSSSLFLLKLWRLRSKEHKAAQEMPMEDTEGDEESLSPPPLLTLLRQGLTVFTRNIMYHLLILAASCGLVARAGPLDLAAHQVALQLWLLPTCLLDALAVAGQGLISDCLGRGRVARARKVARRLLVYGVSCGMFFAGGYWAMGASKISSFFTNDVAVIDKVVPLINLVCLMMPISSLISAGAGILQGAQDFLFQAKLMGVSVTVACSLLFMLSTKASPLSLTGVWLILLGFQMIRVVGFTWRFWWDAKNPLSIHPSPLVLTKKSIRAALKTTIKTMDLRWRSVCTGCYSTCVSMVTTAVKAVMQVEATSSSSSSSSSGSTRTRLVPVHVPAPALAPT